MGDKPIIDYSKCDSDGVCIDVCPVDVFEKEGEKVVVKRPDDCIGCKACEVSCPTKAITIHSD